jgi:hypothetical protein
VRILLHIMEIFSVDREHLCVFEEGEGNVKQILISDRIGHV